MKVLLISADTERINLPPLPYGLAIVAGEESATARNPRAARMANQVERGREDLVREGWTVADGLIFFDDRTAGVPIAGGPV